MAVKSSQNVIFDITVPVAIVGGGAAGMVAALSIADVGLTPLILERDAVPSGSTGLSSGMVPACGTKIQAAEGVEDSVEILSEDITQKAHGEVDQAMVKAVCAASGPAIDWLVESHELELTVVGGFLYPGHSRLRMHAPPSRQGVDLIGGLTVAAERAGVDIMTEAKVADLYISEQGEIEGVAIERPDGSQELIGCQALILACNGFGGNPKLVQRYIPDMVTANYFGHAGNQGEAILWGEELGAATSYLGSYQGHGSVAHPHGVLITWALMTEGGILVNAAGQRFTNEHEGYSEQARRVMAEPDGLAWDIYDQRLHELGLEFEDYVQAEKMGAVKSADSIEALAREFGLPEDALAQTLADCRDYSNASSIDSLGRDFTTKPPLEPPFYGIKVTGSLFHTQGGLTVDTEARVLREDGSAFINLFAAGGAAAGLSGPADWGYLSGNGLLTAVALGRIAGLAATKLIQA
jgi:fumarate reductase flavoprotein subunit